MRVFEHELYQQDLRNIMEADIPWDKLRGKSILISGASGMIGSCLVDAIMYQNVFRDLHCTVYALGRNAERAKERFAYCYEHDIFRFITQDINASLQDEYVDVDFDYILHLASNTHPVAYATDPIGTILTNITGTHNMLELAVAHHATRFAFASSNEIYGENRGDVEFFNESYCGYINCNSLRAGYPESKRCGEALCQAYGRQFDLDVVIPRLTRTYGPTMLSSDTKALSQFIQKGVSRENIVLKSQGTQYYSFTYAADAVSGLLTVLLCGERGEAYNIADASGDILLKDLAGLIAEYAGTHVVFELPNDVEAVGFSTATKARLDGGKLHRLGWQPKYSLEEGLRRTITILRAIGAEKTER